MMGRSDEDFRNEIEAHIALETDRLIADGADPTDARDQATRKFGNVTSARERFYESRRLMWLDELRQDTRYAIRSFARTPAFTLVAVVTLALGIGANTAIFSVVNAVLLRPLPYKDSDRMVRLLETAQAGAPVGTPRPPAGINALEIAALREHARTLSQVGLITTPSLTLTARGATARIDGVRVSPSLFRMASPPLALGRLFEDREEATGADAVVIISHATWQRYFGGDAGVIGESVMIGETVNLPGRPYVIIGVASAAFQFPDRQAQLWMPFVLPTGRLATLQRLVPLARLSDGASIEAATDEVRTIVSQLRQNTGSAAAPPPPPPPSGATPAAPTPSPNRTALAPLAKPNINVMRVQDQLVGPVKPALLILTVAVGFVLLIACVNVANLLLARSAVRQREMAVRRALGATPGRLARQALTESVLLAVAGGTAGTALALGGIQVLRTLATTLPRRDIGPGAALPRLDEVGLDGSVLLFTLAASMATGLLFGLAPALRLLRSGQAQVLREGAGSAMAGFNLLRRQRTQGLLVVAEIAMATMLLVGGGLLLRSFAKLSSVDPGFDTTKVLTFQVLLPGAASIGTPLAFAADFAARLQAAPGIETVGYAEQLPTMNRFSTTVMRKTAAMPPVPPAPPMVGAPIPPETPDTRYVSPGFLDAMGTEVIAGRGFGDPKGARVVLINRALARSGFLGDNPIGQQIYTIGQEPWEIAGIVEDVRQYALDRQPDPQIFFDLRQLQTMRFLNGGAWPGRADYYAVRSSGDPMAIVSTVRGILTQLEPQATIENIATTEQIVSNSISRPRLYAVLLGIFAAVAVALAAIGIYGVMAYSVAQRVREIGIRMALGAERANVMGLVLGQSAILTAAGIAAGLAGAAAVTRYLERLLFGLTPLDLTTFIGVAILFGLVAAVATLVPARRATRVDPLVALRCE